MQQIEVVYENGVLRPLGPVPGDIQEHQHLTVTIEGSAFRESSAQGAESAVSLEAVRQILAQIPGTLAQAVQAEREER